jgi:AraC-like DNA-binding protein
MAPAAASPATAPAPAPAERLVLVGQRLLRPGEPFRAPPLPRNGWLIVRCQRGRGSLAVAGARVALAPGTVLSLPVGGDTDLRCDRGAVLVLSGALLLGPWPGAEGSRSEQVRQGMLADHPELARLLDLAQALSRRGPVPEWQANALGALFAHEIGPGWVAVHDALREVRSLVDDHDGERLRPGDVAAMLDISPATLGRLFRTHARCSPRAWLDQRLVERAARRLAETEDAVADIAAACGFSDATVFTRLFTRLRGESPSSYRRRNRF